MNQVSKCLRKTERGHVLWCDACKRTHHLPDSWTFNGNVDKPTFSPSFLHHGNLIETDAQGKWTGEWLRDAQGQPIKYTCHYILTDGVMHYCSDSTHSFAGKSVPIADLPPHYQDHEF